MSLEFWFQDYMDIQSPKALEEIWLRTVCVEAEPEGLGARWPIFWLRGNEVKHLLSTLTTFPLDGNGKPTLVPCVAIPFPLLHL